MMLPYHEFDLEPPKIGILHAIICYNQQVNLVPSDLHIANPDRQSDYACCELHVVDAVDRLCLRTETKNNEGK